MRHCYDCLYSEVLERDYELEWVEEFLLPMPMLMLMLMPMPMLTPMPMPMVCLGGG